MRRLTFKSGGPVTNCIRYGALIIIIGVFVFKIDLTKLIFKKTVEELKGPVIEKTMTKEQYAEVAELARQPQETIQKPQQFTDETKPLINNERETAITFNGNQMFVPVTIGYRGRMVTIPLLIDTGATGITISPAIAIRLGIKPNETTQATAQLADGRTVATNTAPVAFVSVGPKTKKPSEVHILGSGFEETGLLGMSFLAQFPHFIDVKNQAIKWM
jgi:clan AA aspartic protease (TIGR02281 family)